MRAADLRAPSLAATAWAAALLGLTADPLLALCVVPGACWVLHRRRRGHPWVAPACWLVCTAAVFASASLQRAAVEGGPVSHLGERDAAVRVLAVVTSAPKPVRSRFSERVSFTATLLEVTTASSHLRVRSPVLVLSPSSSVPRGARVRLAGVLRASSDPARAAVMTARGPPELVSEPGRLARGANAVRASVRASVAGATPEAAALVPALVDGDDTALAAGTADDFRTAGLTHLLAVSGTNLTLIVGGLLALARLVGVRAQALAAVGGLGVVGFVLLAGPEPSVLRAAAMGTVALVGLGTVGTRRGLTWLGVGAWLLLLVDPWLSRSVGFALSALATAGILLLVPGWTSALGRWLPRWVAEAIAVPIAAQLACTPLVAAISGQVSLVAVAANLVAAPLVGPTTVLGLLGGLIGLACSPLGRLVAMPAGWGAAGIIAVAHRAADLPVPAIGWGVGGGALLALTAGCVLIAAVLPHVLSRPSWSMAAATVLTVAVLVPLPTPGWPAPGWVMVACSVGQGDALVLAASPHTAVVVDAGPDSRAVDRCLRRLQVRAVPVVVLTHFHADHVDGLPGVLHGRRVGEVVTSPLAEPAGGAAAVRRQAARAGVPVRPAQLGERTSVGALSWQVLAPGDTDLAGSESPPNDASVVLLVEVRGITILMAGDQERPSQAALRRATGDLRADVLKVAHHGSSKQDAELVRGLGARLAVISVGLDNDYGHPAPSTLALLRRAGMLVRRTDLDGDVAVVVGKDGGLGTAAREERAP